MTLHNVKAQFTKKDIRVLNVYAPNRASNYMKQKSDIFEREIDKFTKQMKKKFTPFSVLNGTIIRNSARI